MNKNEAFNDTAAIHPTATIEDLNRVDNATQASYLLDTGMNTSHNKDGSLWIKKPEITSRDNKDTFSAVSSTPSEYGSSSGGSHRSPHASGLGRPVADRNAFIHDSASRHWQTTMSPAERAKRLAEEMDQSLNERRRSSGDPTKSLKIGGTKDIKLN